MTAQAAQDKVEQIGNEHAYRKHPQGFIGIVGDNPVIDIHDKEGADHGNAVDYHTGQSHMAIDGHVECQHIPEPALAGLEVHGFRAGIGPAFQRAEDGITGILGFQLGAGNGAHVIAQFGHDDLGLVAMQCCQHAGRVALKQQDARQREGRDVFQPGAVHDLAAQARPFGCAQAGSGAHLVGTGEAGQQELRRNMLPPKPQQQGKAAQQRRHEVHFRRGKRCVRR